VFRSVKDLESAIREYIHVHNEDPTPFVWTKSAEDILASIAELCHEPLGRETRPLLIFRQNSVPQRLRW
jgi:hypothetical protein